MKKLTASIIFILFTIITASSQSPCLPDGIGFYSQEQIDSFQVNYPGCTEIEGDVWVDGEDIDNLEGLNTITSIGGDCFIGNSWGPVPMLLTSFSGLDNLSTIGGNFEIGDNYALTTLSALDNLTSIEGDLIIRLNLALTSLTGLDNLTSVEGDLHIISNWALTSLTALDNLTSLPGDLRIKGNSLTSLSGLDNLTSIGNNLSIDNNALTSLTGLDNLNSIGGDLRIFGSDSLTSLSGLDNLTSIGNNLSIDNNGSLTSLTGLDNLTSIGNNLYIYYNDSLTSCEALWLCEFLSNPSGGSINIYNNAPGCNDPLEMANACGITLSCLPYGNYYFYTQTEIDNFQTNYANCTELEGDVIISGDNITNLNGLNVLTSIGGDFVIHHQNSLTSLTGLENLTAIGGDLSIHHNDSLINLTGLESLTTTGGTLNISTNNLLTNLTGLDNVTTIGGTLNISTNNLLTNLTGLDNVTTIGGDIFIGKPSYNPYVPSIYGNPSLTSLTGLENLTSIGGTMCINGNISLNSIKALANIDGGSIEDLIIVGNDLLSDCVAQSICDYLSLPSTTFEIHDNALGCNSIGEVWPACLEVGIEESEHISFTIHPNPSDNGSITITLENTHTNLLLTCFNTFGQQVHQQQITNSETMINVSTWSPGIYLAVVYKDGKPVGQAKFVAQ